MAENKVRDVATIKVYTATGIPITQGVSTIVMPQEIVGRNQIIAVTTTGGWECFFGIDGRNIYANVFEIKNKVISHPPDGNRSYFIFYFE